MDRPQIIVANKMDMPEAEENLNQFKKIGESYKICPISAVTKEGIQDLLYAIADKLDKIPVEPVMEDVEDEEIIYKYQSKNEDEFIIRRENEIFVIESKKVEKLFKMTDFNQLESAQRFARILRKMGIDQALRDKGAKMETVSVLLNMNLNL